MGSVMPSNKSVLKTICSFVCYIPDMRWLGIVSGKREHCVVLQWQSKAAGQKQCRSLLYHFLGQSKSHYSGLLVSSGCCKKCHRLNSRNLFSQSSRGWMKVSNQSASQFHCWWSHASWASLPLLKDHWSYWITALPLWPGLTLITAWRSICKYSHMED